MKPILQLEIIGLDSGAVKDLKHEFENHELVDVSHQTEREHGLLGQEIVEFVCLSISAGVIGNTAHTRLISGITKLRNLLGGLARSEIVLKIDGIPYRIEDQEGLTKAICAVERKLNDIPPE